MAVIRKIKLLGKRSRYELVRFERCDLLRGASDEAYVACC